MADRSRLGPARAAPPAPFSAEDFALRVATRLAGLEGEEDGDHRFSPGLEAAFAAMKRRDAAVLVGVVDRGGQATVLLTERAGHLAAHPGQVAFPGGKIDPGETAEEAALREAQEEIGLAPEAVRVIGRAPRYLTGSGYRITPVLALVRPGFRLRLNRAEVADAFETPLAFLMDPANHRQGSRVWQGATRTFFEMPYRERYIWGVTAGILRSLYDRLYAEGPAA